MTPSEYIRAIATTKRDYFIQNSKFKIPSDRYNKKRLLYSEFKIQNSKRSLQQKGITLFKIQNSKFKIQNSIRMV
ncbi:MAG: hypothetical protein F6K40_35800 [Okeania sp. SIO3I5]|uniref:hypothetical protein n=1 Tax=Okeania sp. SIO3I5 TaxID=2607805 RepID=UPI0013B8C483|nr:hypothetical protein [Okeania sp. SIO3I5]NEQ41278.1 hypothetical protein [Okeania sp. SIO3I5]